jgi:hypothetical protein
VCFFSYLTFNVYRKISLKNKFLDGVVGNISPCHGDAPGSIPGWGEKKNIDLYICFDMYIKVYKSPWPNG